jgi:hypothetical protein
MKGHGRKIKLGAGGRGQEAAWTKNDLGQRPKLESRFLEKTMTSDIFYDQ